VPDTVCREMVNQNQRQEQQQFCSSLLSAVVPFETNLAAGDHDDCNDDVCGNTGNGTTEFVGLRPSISV
jgi:hypothetical protein